MDEIINKNSFHSFKKLVRITNYVLRFIKNVKASIKGDSLDVGRITEQECSEAKEIWILSEQKIIDG